ncbi:MAG: peptide ABC transporter substrate-binding protein [Chlamydiia bacterium]|nr:peptide ABC transporter substrate-binding protein [Chlamydiia bacterium]
MIKLKLTFFIIIGLVFLGGCGANPSRTKAKHLRLCVDHPIKTLDPHIGTASPSIHVIKMLYEGLMVRMVDGELKKGVAEDYTISEDKKTYTFFLRKSRWSNGEAVTAYDFESAWKKAIGAPYYGAMFFNSIKNAALFKEGKVSSEQLGVRAIDDYILEVELEHPIPYFLELTACVNFSPVYTKEKGVTNGPFILKKWDFGRSLLLLKNDEYWDANSIQIPGVHIKVVPDQATRHDLFEKGKIDWIGDPLSPLNPDAIESCHLEDHVVSSPLNGINWLVLNTKRFPFNNKNLRKALSYAISRRDITKYLLTGSKHPAMRLIRQGENHYFQDGDLENAQLLFNSALKELGLTRETFPEIVISYCPVFYQPCLVHMIQSQWESAFGVRIKLDPVDQGLLYNQMAKGSFQIGSMFWLSIIQDPVYILDYFRSKGIHSNVSRWTCPFYKELMSQVDEESDLTLRAKLLEQAEAHVIDEMPVIPICFGSALYLKQKNLENVNVSPFMELDIKNTTLKEE